MPSVLFVCTANRFRSPIAAAAFKAKLLKEGRDGTWSIASAGTWTTPGLPAAPLAIRLARQRGLSLDGHRTYPVSQTLLATFDLVLVMDMGHKEALLAEFPFTASYLLLLSEVVDGIRYDISDPANSPDLAGKFLEELCEVVERGYEKICLLAETICVP